MKIFFLIATNSTNINAVLTGKLKGSVVRLLRPQSYEIGDRIEISFFFGVKFHKASFNFPLQRLNYY
jgi:hypothetical protein